MINDLFQACIEELNELIREHDLQDHDSKVARLKERNGKNAAEEAEERIRQLEGQIVKKQKKLQSILDGTYVPPPPKPKVVDISETKMPPPEPQAEEIGRSS